MDESTKRCTKCGETKKLSEFSRDVRKSDGRRSACRACCSAQFTKWRTVNLDYDHARHVTEEAREASRNRAAAKREEDPVAANAKLRTYYRLARRRVFDHYGWVCECCGRAGSPEADRSLSIDHINGDGAEHREELFGNRRHGTGWRFYLWLISSGFPDGYSVLCPPCNTSKRKGGRCRLVHAKLGWNHG